MLRAWRQLRTTGSCAYTIASVTTSVGHGSTFRGVLVAALAFLVAGCGGDGDGGTVGGGLPPCAEERQRVDAPPGLPPQLPLPPGLVITSAQQPADGHYSLRGIVAGDLDGVAGFFRRRLPERGFELGRGDAEEHEQESPFTGHGYRGSWRVVKHPGGCPVVAVFVVLIAQR